MSYNTYPPILTEAPPPENPQIPYHLNVVQAKRQGLIAKEKVFKKKYKKYHKILNRLTRLNAVLTGIPMNVANVAMLDIPVAMLIPLEQAHKLIQDFIILLVFLL